MASIDKADASKAPAAKSPEQLAKQAARAAANAGKDKLLQLLAKSVGKAKLEFDDLGKVAKDTLAELIFPKLLAYATEHGVGAKSSIPSQELFSALIDLKWANALDGLLNDKPQGDTVLDGKKTSIAEERGRFSLVNLPENSYLHTVFKALDINPKHFSREVAENLRGYFDARVDLVHDKKRNKFLMSFAQLLSKPYVPPTSTAAVDETKAAAAAGQNGKAKVKPDIGATPNTGIGLESTAPTEANTGNRNNATAIRAALLSGLNKQDEKIERTAASVLKTVLDHLGVKESSDPEVKKKRKMLHGELVKLLRPSPGSTDGKVSPSELFARLLNVLSQQFPEMSQVLDVASGTLSDAIVGNKEKGTPEYSEALADMTAKLFTSLAADVMGGKTGALEGASQGIVTDLMGHIGEGKAKADSTKGASEASAKADKTGESSATAGYTGVRDDLPESAKAAAASILKEYKVNPNHPKMAEMVNIVAEVVARHSDSNGQLDPIAFAIGLHKFIEEHTGVPNAMLEVTQRNLEGSARQFGIMNQHFETQSGRLHALEGGKDAAAHQAEIDELKAQLPTWDAQLKATAQRIDRDLGVLTIDGLQRIGELVTTGAVRGGQNAAPASRDASREGSSEGGANKVRSIRGIDHGVVGNNAGITGGGRPEDRDERNLTAQQERAVKCAEILRDPSLCIEDKIFLFMMWFVFYADKEREKKMEEMVAMDRKNADTARERDQLTQQIKNLKENTKIHRRKLDEAGAELEKARQNTPPDPSKIKVLEANYGAAKADLDGHNAKITECEGVLQKQKLEMEEGTRSREIMMMELDRFTKMRDKVMDMARSMLENSNRNLEKIFR